MSTFSTRGGLYERAQKKYKLADGGCWAVAETAGQPARMQLQAPSCAAWPHGGSTHVPHPGRCFRLRPAAGKMLFTYAFFDRQRIEAQAFFADIYR